MKVAQIVKSSRIVLHLLDGSQIEPLSPSSEDAYCVIRGTIPPHVSVPLHSHADPESFYLLSGEAEALVETAGEPQWQTLGPGDFIHIPGGAKHAWRNPSIETALMLITCTAKLGRALEEMGKATTEYGGRSLTPAAVQRLLDIAGRYGYWLGSPEENAAVGIELPTPTFDNASDMAHTQTRA
jgi:quercetin dioxygenase-like cupin family protein